MERLLAAYVAANAALFALKIIGAVQSWWTATALVWAPAAIVAIVAAAIALTLLCFYCVLRTYGRHAPTSPRTRDVGIHMPPAGFIPPASRLVRH